MNETQNPVAGWYPDPHGATGQLRWWDGTNWTAHTQNTSVLPSMTLQSPSTIQPSKPMSKRGKTVLGILTILPVILFFLLFLSMLAFIFSASHAPKGSSNQIPWEFVFFMVFEFALAGLSIGLQIYYIVNIFKNDRVRKDMQIIWLLVILFGGFLTQPVYFYLNIWREAPEQQLIIPPQLA